MALARRSADVCVTPAGAPPTTQGDSTMNRSLSFLLGCGALALAATTTAPAARADDDEARGGACSSTAQRLHSACGYEAADDLEVARAKCINLADAGKRAACLREARESHADERRTCDAQLQARRQVCGQLGEARYDPPWDAALFDANFRQLSNPNPYFPLGIGHRWEYRGGDEINTVEVLDKTKLIEGVTCIVYRDLVYQGGRLKEATDDWFAAARDGSTWYCGEEVKDYESFDGDRPRRPELVSTDGSFKHGRDFDKAGLIMPAAPRAGMVWREEFSLGNAEDVSQVLTAQYAWGGGGALDHLVPRELAQRLCSHRDCVVTKNGSPLEPGVYALKYYARGIGFFLETKPQGGETLQLVACNFDARCVALPGAR
jgi:hypothetical protein